MRYPEFDMIVYHAPASKLVVVGMEINAILYAVKFQYVGLADLYLYLIRSSVSQS